MPTIRIFLRLTVKSRKNGIFDDWNTLDEECIARAFSIEKTPFFPSQEPKKTPEKCPYCVTGAQKGEFIVTGYEDDEIWGYTANLFLLNKTDKTVMFSVDDASVNGFMADPFYATSVSAGKCAFSSMAWSDTTLEENGITEVEEIEVLFRAYDADDFMGEDYGDGAKLIMENSSAVLSLRY